MSLHAEYSRMEFVASHLLPLILFLPALTAIVILFLPRARVGLIRGVAFAASLVPLGLSIWLWLAYDAAHSGYQFVEQADWYRAVGSSYHLGVDGLSVPMVLLTTLLTPLALLLSWSMAENVRSYMALFLMLETGMLGVFLAIDLLLFFVFWEIGLIPMYFLINQWGSANREDASFKFLIYTMAGSLGLRDRLRHQGPHLAVPYLVAGRPHRSPDRRFDDPGRGVAQAGCLRVPAPGVAALSCRSQDLRRPAWVARRSGDHLRGVRRLGSGGLQASGGLLLGQPHGVCCFGDRRSGLRSRHAGRPRRGDRAQRRRPANVQSRPIGGRHVPAGRRGLRSDTHPGAAVLRR